MKIAYVRTGGGGVQTNAYALRTGGGGGGSKIGNLLRSYFMDGPLSDNFINQTWKPFRAIEQAWSLKICFYTIF